MAFSVKDAETDQLVRELAARTGEGITGAIKTAVSERLERLPPDEADKAARWAKIEELLAEVKTLPVYDDRTADEIIGYNDDGHFD